MTKLPVDDLNQPIPVMRPRAGGAQVLTAGTTTSRSNVFTSGTRVISMIATAPIYYQTGNSAITVDSTGHYLPSSFYTDISLGYDMTGVEGLHTNLAVLRVGGTSANVYVSEKE